MSRLKVPLSVVIGFVSSLISTRICIKMNQLLLSLSSHSERFYKKKLFQRDCRVKFIAVVGLKSQTKQVLRFTDEVDAEKPLYPVLAVRASAGIASSAFGFLLQTTMGRYYYQRSIRGN
ncbi:uncharacterized protein BDZ83DRAFT_631494 [Colletotrichum acutatum]|uniref:Uncharacterized protein n=1 Tax=Glomerella acutata TaxID=27357 RepID=A0AAD8UHG7_GLOAC|nr:uncharacterized protein BDZ83DRAFT_631494 [Colletotrichum acutatum]KAK1720213.1 hypothetical protein BDZ83DRAFT_631494 [Colletotrichum acutatum]